MSARGKVDRVARRRPAEQQIALVGEGPAAAGAILEIERVDRHEGRALGVEDAVVAAAEEGVADDDAGIFEAIVAGAGFHRQAGHRGQRAADRDEIIGAAR